MHTVLPTRPVRAATLIGIVALALAGCRGSEGSYQGYADRTAAVGDSA
ncbi:MAG: hypothetical protein K0S86_4288, partial [Geminicoccaceae bacterium]|nr:hypothetical protein [Geminicoccaceae bacterium]